MGAGATSLNLSLNDIESEPDYVIEFQFKESDDKAYGDRAHSNGMLSDAIFWYTKVLVSLPIRDSWNEEDKNDSINSPDKYSALIYKCRSRSLLANEQPLTGLQDALKSIDLYYDWYKPHFYAALAFSQLERYKDAWKHIKICLNLKPDNSTIIQFENHIYEKIKSVSNEDVINNGLNEVQNGHIRVLDSGIYSWGNGQNGQLGLGLPLIDKSTPSCIKELGGKSIVDVSCGSMHSVCVTMTGEVYSWGNNEYLQLGQGVDSKECSIPRIVDKLLGVKVLGVSCGAGHSIVVSSAGMAYSW